MIDKLVKHNLNCSIASGYEYNSLTLQELLSEYYKAINECVDVSNKSLSFLEWLQSEGLENEVNKLMELWKTDGTFESIINEDIFNGLNNKVDEKYNELNSKYEELQPLKQQLQNINVEKMNNIIVVEKKGKEILIGYKYDKNTDMRLHISTNNPNKIPMLMYQYKFNNPNPIPSSDFSTFGTEINDNVSTDYISPIICKAKSNINGDFPDSLEFCGGNHNVLNTGDLSAGATARNVGLEVFINGVLYSENENINTYCSNVRIMVYNKIQATNTKKTNGGGREVLNECVRYEFNNTKYELDVDVTLQALEPLEVIRYYGMQVNYNGFSKATNSKVGFIKENYPLYWSDLYPGNVSGTGEHPCRKVVISGGNNDIITMEIKNLGLGGFYYKGSDLHYAFSMDYQKAYFNLIATSDWSVALDLENQGVIYWKGTYKWYKGKEVNNF